jgi:hypothetical protein
LPEKPRKISEFAVLRCRSRFVENPGYQDGYHVKNHHRSGKKHHVCDIGRRGQDGGGDQDKY